MTDNDKFKIKAYYILDKFHTQEENNLDNCNFLPFKLGQVQRSSKYITFAK